MKELPVGAESAGQRADVFVASIYPNFSRSSLRGLFDEHKISINHKPVKAGHKLREGEIVFIDSQKLFIEPKPIKLPVIYEDDGVVAINKPAGMLTHSKGALNLEPTVASFIKTKITDDSLSGNRAGVVHRLDRATSGVIIGAKVSKALAYLQKQFSSRKVKKTYLAIVEGDPKPEAAIIDAPIARNPRKPQTFKVSADGKSARTKYKLLKKLNKSSNLALVELEPETGRTHQLRVHMAYIGHPILGDAVYGGGGEYLYLHAHKLSLRLPNGELKTFSSPLPDEFKEAIKK